ncbi:MAG: multiheme c-type cytochrome [Deferrisomatales bacterium]
MVLDGGDLLFPFPSLAGHPEAGLLRDKARVVARATVRLGADAVNVGRRDLAGGIELLRELGGEYRVPWLSTNLRLAEGQHPFPRWRVVDWGGLRVGLVGLVPPDPALDPQLGIRVDPPAPALREALAALGRVDAVVCLSNLGLDAERELLGQVPGVALAVGGGSGHQLPVPLVAGDTAFLHATERGRFLGLLEVGGEALRRWKTPREAGEQAQRQARVEALRSQAAALPAGPDREQVAGALRAQAAQAAAGLSAPGGALFSHRLAPLDESVPEDPEVAVWVAEALAREARWRREQALVAPVAAAPAPLPPGPFHVGVPACRSCHPRAYAAWLQTPHARAYARLGTDDRRPECVLCHASRLRQVSGPGFEPVVGCEVCHGPGGNHRARVNIARVPSEALCRNCHRGDHGDRGFDYRQGYLRVRCDR